ncbi:MAG TPA: hypothetical protein VNP73_04665, partial [Actinomycetota bacterium]|nr:hypothetical protein [Actinomycetota bacterium]
RLAIECQSYTWHSGQEAWERDVDRLSKLHRLGWIAHLVKNRDLDEDPDGTLNRIWALYQQRAA